ncbi:MAG TPA: hypothetical protein VJA26_18730, partial [Gammaproteobacteria bacterium]|nr:hypothetical protein [Gammaproteobacteria bacterium]
MALKRQRIVQFSQYIPTGDNHRLFRGFQNTPLEPRLIYGALRNLGTDLCSFRNGLLVLMWIQLFSHQGLHGLAWPARNPAEASPIDRLA